MRTMCVVRVDVLSEGCYISMGSRSDVKSKDGALCVSYSTRVVRTRTKRAIGGEFGWKKQASGG